jgi:hypothetical protein
LRYDAPVAFEQEVDDILRELLRERGAIGARVVSAGDADELAGVAHARRALGHGAELVVTVGALADPELPAAIERAARELRACIRRHGVERVPEVTLVGRVPRPRAALLAKARAFLEALAAMHGALSALVLRGGQIVAEGGAVDAAQRERLTFLRKRIDAEAARRRGRSSHAEIVGDDVYARSFWFDAYLVIFFAGPGFAVDFVRHRARAVARALAVILPHLDDEPPSPANVRPLPPRK